MRATRKDILTDARNGLLGNGCTQDLRQILDVRNLHLGRATPITSSGADAMMSMENIEEQMHL